ncbi:MAG TPA: hypothetical protein VKI00_20375 [Mycobacterium sp.]|uniref:hypothetical protein n=1 Tax=Mycobacterium sp. TaxID=1785 RepID=UPI002C18C58C|nr:hypothetical protein [Mycobacterium sp.]HME77913.1 hypothetical protein [Mycobacterium sp.]
MALDRRMAELRARHAREINRLHREFVQQDPTIDPGVDNAAMTPKQAEAWRQFTADEDAKFDRARRRLAAELRAESARQAAQTS